MGRARVSALACERLAVCVTGASRGFGRSAASGLLRAAHKLGHARALHFVLCASQAGPALATTRDMLLAIAPDLRVSAELVALPLDAPAPAAHSHLADALAAEPWRSAQQHILLNNAGVMGTIAPTADLRFEDYALPLLVNAAGHGAVAGAFLSATEGLPECRARYILHTSSIVAKAPQKCWASYSASKAAANMLHMAIADEYRHTLNSESSLPPTKVLQYSPGALRTDMTLEARNAGIAPVTSPHWVDPDVSAARMIKLLLLDNFSSGESIDFFSEKAEQAAYNEPFKLNV